MRNRCTVQPDRLDHGTPSQPVPARWQSRFHQAAGIVSPLLASVIVSGVMVGWANTASAQTPPVQPVTPAAPAISTPAPPPLTRILTQIDAAATEGNLEALLGFFSPSFTNSDGLTYDGLRDSLKQLWQQFPDLTYKTELTAWQAEGGVWEASTTTTLTGQQVVNGRTINLTSTITSRQRFEGQKIVKQDILSERSQLTSGDAPPQLQINLPAQVAPGGNFDFDAIVTEPLGDRLLLGAVLEEAITARNYLNPAPVNLELLSSGGLFKVGTAPSTPGNQWISAVVVRDDGMTAVTQRLRVAR